MSKHLFSALAVFAVLSLTPAYAANAPSTSEKKAEATTTEAKKPKRELSEKQKHNIAVMRECGSEWRTAKAAGETKGKKWRDYLKDCRVRKKTA